MTDPVLALVLIVTPVIFYWLRERDLRRVEAEGLRNLTTHNEEEARA